MVATAFIAGCDTIGSDLSSFAESFNPPTPLQAAQWAVDTNNPENQRRGIALLASAPWGGAEAYVRLYRLYIEENTDPLVKAFAIRALGRHGDANDALLIGKQLDSPFRIVRFEAAKASQRLHLPAAADLLWPKLINENEDPEVRAEIALALGHYPNDAVFQALVAALDQRELAVNAAALDSLQTLTGQDLGLDPKTWLAWEASTTQVFLRDERFLYPTYTRDKRFLDYLLFWIPLSFENPGLPVGTSIAGPRRTYEGEQPSEDFVLPDLQNSSIRRPAAQPEATGGTPDRPR
jgi:hypothetical protein